MLTCDSPTLNLPFFFKKNQVKHTLMKKRKILLVHLNILLHHSKFKRYGSLLKRELLFGLFMPSTQSFRDKFVQIQTQRTDTHLK